MSLNWAQLWGTGTRVVQGHGQARRGPSGIDWLPHSVGSRRHSRRLEPSGEQLREPQTRPDGGPSVKEKKKKTT